MKVRAEIRLDTYTDAKKFVDALNSHGGWDKYIIENFDGSLTVDARSILGVVYAASEFTKLYLVNMTEDGAFPAAINDMRA